MNTTTIELIQGVEGQCLAINGRRVAGPKPWGGGLVIKVWKTETDRIAEALKLADPNESPATRTDSGG